MFLKSLTISGAQGVIRKINFRSGLNLIVDETPGNDGKGTGNNVGKTTVLMLIDFCLGSSGKNIYTDPENQKEEHQAVKSFLIERKVLITLILKEDLGNPQSEELKIERNFLPRKQLIRRINGQSTTEEEFEETLTSAMFPGHYGSKPTFRQIISHNIRYKDQTINNTLKTLDKFSRDDEYETLYLFLLGCDFDQGNSKQELVAKIRVEQAFVGRLEREQTLSAYEASLALLHIEIDELNVRRTSFNVNPNFRSDLDQLSKIKFQLSAAAAEVSRLRIRREIILESREELLAGHVSVDTKQLRQIYIQAKDQIAGLHKTFDDLCRFHNSMIAEKIAYIAKDLPVLESELASKSEIIETLLLQERELALNLTKSASYISLEDVIVRINEKYRQKGEFETVVRQIADSQSTLSDLTRKLDDIDNVLFSTIVREKIKHQLDKFNRKFATISETLYGERYALKVDPALTKGRRIYKFSAFNTNFSSGKKQGEISCFDIAYTLFADQEGIPCMHFLLNDKRELMHDNQLVRIGELVEKEGIQFVASILKDKLPIELNKEEYFVVKLSQNDKLFRIEGDDC